MIKQLGGRWGWAAGGLKLPRGPAPVEPGRTRGAQECGLKPQLCREWASPCYLE